MKLVNLQPHPVTSPEAKLAASGKTARVEEILSADSKVGGFTAYRQELKSVYVVEDKNPDISLPFPDEREGVIFVVSRMVCEAMPHRGDLLTPVGQLRDENGRIVGCQGLAFNPYFRR